MKSLDIALDYHANGLFVLPIKLDGSKSPSAKTWTFYDERCPTPDELINWFKEERGIGIVCGRQSGQLEVIDFENETTYRHWKELVDQIVPNLFGTFVVVKTPGSKHQDDQGCIQPGYHVYYRINSSERTQSQKLALNNTGELLVETKGHGGYVIAPGSAIGVHSSGRPYEFVQGNFGAIPVICAEDRETLIDLAKSLNENVVHSDVDSRYAKTDACEERPGDRFNAQGDWSILEDHGWQHLYTKGNCKYWRRPGKTTVGISATTGYCKGSDGTDRLHVFSTSAKPFDNDRTYSRFAVLALLNFQGDFSAAAQHLASTEQHPGIFVHNVQVLLDTKNSINLPTTKNRWNDIEDWQEPVPLSQPALPKFPLSKLSTFVADYCQALAESTQTPVDLVVQLSLANHAAALAGRIKVVRTPDHCEPLNLWTMVALPSGNRKSAVLKEIFQGADHVAQLLLDEAMPLIADAKQKKHMLGKKKSAAEKLACKVDASLTEIQEAEAKAMELARTLEEFSIPAYPQLVVDDCTPEHLAKTMAAQQGRIVVASTESSFLENCLGRYSEQINCEVYLQGHAGDTIRVGRVGREPLLIHDPRLSIGCAVQNSVLAGLGKHETLRNRGFLARFLYAIPTSLIGYRKTNPPSIPHVLKERYVSLSTSLWNAKLSFREGRLVEDGLHLSPEAHAIWLEFSQEIERRMGEDGDLSLLTDWAGKLPGGMLRVAGVMQIVENSLERREVMLPISGLMMARVCVIAREYWIPHAKAAFTLMYGDPRTSLCLKILRKLTTDKELMKQVQEDNGTISRRSIHRTVHGSCPQAKQVDPLIEVLIDHGFLRPTSPMNPKFGKGRPQTMFTLNPYFLKTQDIMDKNTSAVSTA